MKKLIALVLAVLMAMGGISACAEGVQERRGADLSYARFVEMAQYMRELATGDYLDIKQVPESMKTTARTWAAGISDTPRMVLQLDVNGMSTMVETRVTFSQDPEIVSYEAQSNTMIDVWQYLAYSAGIEAALTESDYEAILNVNGQLNASMMYAEKGTSGNAMYIVLYENAAPILLIVTAENDAVSIRGMFLPSAKLAKCKNYGQVSMWLMLNGFSMTCQEILPH